MANHQKPNFFWPGYADLMNNLFYIMLVLYVLTFVILKNEQAKYKADAEQLRQIRRIENAVNNIDTTRHYFAYDSIYQKHVLSINVQFASGQYDIHQLSGNTRDSLRKAGERIRNLILQSQKEKALEVKFLVIIEGQASRDGSPRNFPISHERARSLLNFWKNNSIDMERLKNCELVVAGSGEGGLPRIQPDVPPANQRFLIHIIPKIGSFKKGKNRLR
jgi:outer membrane protein OmpA-like peptidoglycan-associated protein